MYFSFSHFPRTLTLGAATMGLLVFGGLTPRPAAAQDLNYQLEGVTFDDGAIAYGDFNYNPTTDTFGSFDITTTNGVTDTLVGTHYDPLSKDAPSAFLVYDLFGFGNGGSPHNILELATVQPADRVGIFALLPGSRDSGNDLTPSGEFAPSPLARAIVTGSLVVTPAAVPEASTTVSFGLLLALGLGGAVIAAKKKKAVA